MKRKLNDIMHFFPIFIKALKLMWKASKISLLVISLSGLLTGLLLPFQLLVSKNFIDVLTNALTVKLWSPYIIYWLFVLLLVSVLGTIMENITSFVNAVFSDRLSTYITKLMLDKAVDLPMESYDNETVYNKLRASIEETPDKCRMIIDIIHSFITSVIQIIGTLAVILSLSGYIVGISFLTAIPLFLLSCYINKFWFNIFQRRLEKYRLLDTLKELIIKNDNIKELKLFNISKYLKDIIINQQTKFNHENRANRRKFSFLNVGFQSINNLISFIIKIWIIVTAFHKQMTIGAVSMFMSAVDSFQASVNSLMTELSSAYEQLLYVDYIFEIIGMSTEDDKDFVQIEEPINRIEFKNVYFQYPGTVGFVLRNITFVMERGKTYAFVGVNGTGKTTILKLLLKLYIPTKGDILINNISIKQISARSLRGQITAIFQDFIKYPFSISKNIALGDIEQEDDNVRIMESAKQSGASKFINQLPEKYNTQLQREWSEGIELSGGQWQKLAIARCFFKESNIMILDEPFSSLDALSEKEIIDNMREEKKDKICIFVTHRYTSIQLADVIIVMQDGSIIESGSHCHLIDLGGLYSELINAQILKEVQK